jgi:hypothetical protein
VYEYELVFGGQLSKRLSLDIYCEQLGIHFASVSP